MLLIALSWTYILFTSVNLGVLFRKFFSLKSDNFAITVILGWFTSTIFAGVWAFFGRINWEFHIVLLLLNALLALKYKNQILLVYQNFAAEIRQLSAALKVALAIITLLIIAQCAAPPYIVDNESYYIQTVKWLNEYGYVRGLANLHYFFGQTSGWHLTQSVFSFSFLYPNFNDLSGFCLLIGNIFAIGKLNAFYTQRNGEFLIIGLLPLANVFFFRFIGSPSPDIAIYVLSFVIFWIFIKNLNDNNSNAFKLILILVLFTIYIKPTSVALLLLPLLMIMRSKSFRHFDFRVALLSIGMLLLFVGKCLVLTGYPFFPFPTTFAGWTPQHQVPESIVRYFSENKSAAFQLSDAEFNAMSHFEIVKKWLQMPGLDGLFNKLATVLLLIAPLFIRKFFNQRQHWLLYTAMVLQMLLLFMLSPQYRFFFNFVLLFSFLTITPIIKSKVSVNILLGISIIASAIVLLVPMNFAMLTQNELAKESQTFTGDMMVNPSPNSKSISSFEKISDGNLDYYSPAENSFLWQTGNGALPCVNKHQVGFFDRYFNVKPQLIKSDVGDGFYSKQTR